MDIKQQQQLAVRPVSITKKHASVDGKAVSTRERSALANASFRVYYSLRAGAVPFLWESSPGTPKTAAASVSPARETSSLASSLPPISPPPSYQSSVQMKAGRRCGQPRSSSWPVAAAAGDIVRALLGMLGLGKRRRHHRSSTTTRRRSASISELPPPFASLPY